VASYTDPKSFGILISPVADYNLSAFYTAVVDNEANRVLLRSFFGCLTHALHFLHSSKIRHRDIKPENILIKGSAVYLADFGISLDWQNLSRSTTEKDSAKSWIYCAPEVANYEKRNSSSDIWSLGCVFLEMFTVLKGHTVQDLRAIFRARSDGSARFYENFNVAMEQLEDLSGGSISTDNEVGRWIREMIVMEPKSRITAQSLSVSIAAFKRKNRDEPNPFCGDCCSHDTESSSDAASDNDVWARADITTPATSPPETDDIRRLEEPNMDVKGQSLPSHPDTAESPNSNVIENMSNLHLEDTIASSSSNVDVGRDRALQEAADAKFAAQLLAAEEATIAASQQGQNPTSVIEEESPSSPSTAKPLTQQIPDQTDTTLDGPDLATSKHLTERKTTSRQQLLDEITLQTWPFANFYGRLPALVASSWRSPEAFLEAVKSDTRFMEYLRISNPAQFEKFKKARLDDVIPIIYLFLLNGLDINSSAFRDEGSSPERKLFHDGVTPLFWVHHWEISARNELIKLLIGFGADLEARAADQNTVTTCASATGNVEIVRVLLDLGCHPDEQDNSGITALHRAAWNGHVDVMNLLLDRGASTINAQDKAGKYPLSYAATLAHLEAVKVLVKRGAHLVEPFTDMPIAIGPAAFHGHIEVLEYLLSTGLYNNRVDYETPQVMTALQGAASSGKHEAVKLLIDRGANFHKPMLSGKTPLQFAAMKGHHLVVEMLIKHGASFRTTDSEGFTVGTNVAHVGHVNVMKVLLENGMGADEGNTTTYGGWRPLHQACVDGHLEMVKLLLRHGADPSRRIIGRFTTPLGAAKKRGHNDIVVVLEQAIRERKRGRLTG
jgi:ankyrin repeat protein/serine/threonine protein kinase